jgi:hypothetical protein
MWVGGLGSECSGLLRDIDHVVPEGSICFVIFAIVQCLESGKGGDGINECSGLLRDMDHGMPEGSICFVIVAIVQEK